MQAEKVGYGTDCRCGASRAADGGTVSRWPEYEGYEDATAEQWIAQLGFRPAEEVGLWAGCKDPLDHRILRHLALILAERYGGILDLDGAWCPPMDLDWLPDVDPDGFWQKPVGAVPYAYAGPGRIYELHYITARNTHWYSNLADVEAFRYALQGEHFWLIK